MLNQSEERIKKLESTIFMQRSIILQTIKFSNRSKLAFKTELEKEKALYEASKKSWNESEAAKDAEIRAQK
mgnify:CR=1 FL=1